jgi:hypothetical protein
VARETAEDRIARVVKETMAAERRQQEDQANPHIGTLRRIVREELEGILKGRRETPREEDDKPDGDDGNLIDALFGGAKR